MPDGVCGYCGNAVSGAAIACSTRCSAALRRIKGRVQGKSQKRAKRPPVLHMRLADRDALIDAANGVCAICASPGGARKLHIDHSHATGALRGVLCHSCNVGIGHFRDSVALLNNAIEYLKKHA